MYFFEYSDEFLCAMGGVSFGLFGIAMTGQLAGALFGAVGVLMTMGVMYSNHDNIGRTLP